MKPNITMYVPSPSSAGHPTSPVLGLPRGLALLRRGGGRPDAKQYMTIQALKMSQLSVYLTGVSGIRRGFGLVLGLGCGCRSEGFGLGGSCSH